MLGLRSGGEGTVTKTETVTQEKTIVSTTTITQKEVYTTTQIIPTTKIIYGPKLDTAEFLKVYSGNNLEVSAKLTFNPRSEVITADLAFIYPQEATFKLERKEPNVYVGRISIYNPKPVYYLAVWDATTKEGVKASNGLRENDRTVKMQMPLRREEYEPFKELADSLFEYTLGLDRLNPEKTFKISFDALVQTNNTNVDQKIREAVVKYALNVTKYNLQPYELSALAAFTSNFQNLLTQYPTILDSERSALQQLNEQQEYLEKYYFYPYLISNIPELQKYRFFANAAALHSARIIKDYLSLNLANSNDREKAFLVLDKVIIPRVKARIDWFEKGETVLPITGNDLIDLMGSEKVALVKLADIVTHADFQFYSFRDINKDNVLMPIKPQSTTEQDDFIKNAIYNTENMLNGNTTISHKKVWRDIHDPEKIKIYLEGNASIPDPSHPYYELYKFWAEVYMPFILQNGTNSDRIALLWFRYGPLNLLKKSNGEYIHEENRKYISQMAAESVGESVYVTDQTLPFRPTLHGDIMISLSEKIWKSILNNKEKFLTPFYVEIVNGIPNAYGIKEKWLEPFRKYGTKPWFVWYTSPATQLVIYQE